MVLQATSDPVELDVGVRRAVLRVDGGGLVRLGVRRVEVLTRSGARALVAELGADSESVLVVFERSSPDARAVLRECRVSYAAADGELFVFAPPVYVERAATRPAVRVDAAPSAPFAARASRVPRWLLLHSEERFSLRELARRLQLSESLVSRTVSALAGDALVAVEPDSSDARVRRARLRDAAGLLDAFERAAAARRVRRVTWDVGAHDAAGAIDLLREAAKRTGRAYALGGLAGAALVRRVVEPADVTLWIDREDLDVWAQALLGSRARPGPGRITAQLAPDSFMLSLAEPREGIMVADPVQLYLDCRLGGERALEAAEAIRAERRW
jgi:DNA-binding MarR family transcriptional regulator